MRLVALSDRVIEMLFYHIRALLLSQLLIPLVVGAKNMDIIPIIATILVLSILSLVSSGYLLV